MKKSLASMRGATLLEILLVLAVAAMIIVMSIRFYRSANASQQAAEVIRKITAITAAGDSLALTSGSYTKMSTTILEGALANAGGTTTPWGGGITASAAEDTHYTITISAVPPDVCGALYGYINGNPNASTSSACGTSAAPFVYTYYRNPSDKPSP